MARTLTSRTAGTHGRPPCALPSSSSSPAPCALSRGRPAFRLAAKRSDNAGAGSSKRPGAASDGSAALVAPALGMLNMLRDVVGPVTSAASGTAASTAVAPPEDLRSATYGITALNLALFVLTAGLPLLPRSALALAHGHGAGGVWQLLTSPFMHGSLEGLASTVFFTYTFGRVLERQHGTVATWATYLACGAGAAALASLLLPAKAGLLTFAGPAAALGLFVVAIVIPRISRKPLEVACLAPFAAMETISRYSALAPLVVQDGVAIGHLVHMAGAVVVACAAAGVLSVVARWRQAVEEKRAAERRAAEAARQEEALSGLINMAGQAAAELGKKLR